MAGERDNGADGGRGRGCGFGKGDEGGHGCSYFVLIFSVPFFLFLFFYGKCVVLCDLGKKVEKMMKRFT